MRATQEQRDLARALVAARRDVAPITRFPGAMPETMDQAYAIQDAAIALDGRQVGGWKVGRIPPDLVARYGAERLTGPIFADEIVDGTGGAPRMGIFPGGFGAVEAELLLRLGDIGDGEHDIASVRECVEEVRTGIEVASSPFAEINMHGPAVTASDFGNNKGLVLGPRIEGWRERDLVRMPVELRIDGQIVGSATMETMLDGPFGSVSYLLRTLRARGIAPAPGTWVSAGAITGVHEIAAGQHAEALFGGDLRVACEVVQL